MEYFESFFEQREGIFEAFNYMLSYVTFKMKPKRKTKPKLLSHIKEIETSDITLLITELEYMTNINSITN